jgi:hypothetical protein
MVRCGLVLGSRRVFGGNRPRFAGEELEHWRQLNGAVSTGTVLTFQKDISLGKVCFQLPKKMLHCGSMLQGAACFTPLSVFVDGTPP